MHFTLYTRRKLRRNSSSEPDHLLRANSTPITHRTTPLVLIVTKYTTGKEVNCTCAPHEITSLSGNQLQIISMYMHTHVCVWRWHGNMLDGRIRFGNEEVVSTYTHRLSASDSVSRVCLGASANRLGVFFGGHSPRHLRSDECLCAAHNTRASASRLSANEPTSVPV